MEQAISMYRGITASEEYRNLERLRDRTMHNEASALGNARDEGRREVAHNMKTAGIPIAQIAQWTGFSEAQIADL